MTETDKGIEVKNQMAKLTTKKLMEQTNEQTNIKTYKQLWKQTSKPKKQTNREAKNNRQTNPPVNKQKSKQAVQQRTRRTMKSGQANLKGAEDEDANGGDESKEQVEAGDHDESGTWRVEDEREGIHARDNGHPAGDEEKEKNNYLINTNKYYVSRYVRQPAEKKSFSCILFPEPPRCLCY